MLVLKRREGQWVEIRHEASGDVLHIRAYDIDGDRLNLAFDDAPRNFIIQRPERIVRPPLAGRVRPEAPVCRPARESMGVPATAPAQAVEVLNRHRHRGHAGWYIGGTEDTAIVYGEDNYETFTPFEAAAIAERYLVVGLANDTAA